MVEIGAPVVVAPGLSAEGVLLLVERHDVESAVALFRRMQEFSAFGSALPGAAQSAGYSAMLVVLSFGNPGLRLFPNCVAELV